MTAAKNNGAIAFIKLIIWPAVILAALVIFKSDIDNIFPKIRKGSIQISPKSGFNITFEQILDAQTSQIDDLQSAINDIVAAAAKSQDGAITLAWNLLDKRLRKIMATTNLNNGIFIDVKTSIATLISGGFLARNTLPSLGNVETERNRILAHQQEGQKAMVDQAIITAIQIIRNVYSISIQKNIVEASGIKVYSDEACKNEIPDLTAVKLREIMADGIDPIINVFPTTRTDYKVGESLTWAWHPTRRVAQAWYHDPKTNEIRLLSGGVFTGGNVDDL